MEIENSWARGIEATRDYGIVESGVQFPAGPPKFIYSGICLTRPGKKRSSVPNLFWCGGRGLERECPPKIFSRPRFSAASFLPRSEREAFCYWGFVAAIYVFRFAKATAKADRHSLRSRTISLRAAPFIKGAGSSLDFLPIWSPALSNFCLSYSEKNRE